MTAVSAHRTLTSRPLLNLELSRGASITLAIEAWDGASHPSLRIVRTSVSGHATSFAINHRARFEIAAAILAWLEACDAPSSPADALLGAPPASGPSGDADASAGIVVAGAR